MSEDYSITAIQIILTTLKLNQELAESNSHISNKIYLTIKKACIEKLTEITEAIELDNKIREQKRE